jgi:hypothetical protein
VAWVLVRQAWQGSAGLESGKAGEASCGGVREGVVRQVRHGEVRWGLVGYGAVTQARPRKAWWGALGYGR